MHRSEDRETVQCAACGALVDPSASSSFAFGAESALCFECAADRGGRFDSDGDRWIEAPRFADLAREES